MKRILLGLSIVLVVGALALIWLFAGDDGAHSPAVAAPGKTPTPAAHGTHDDAAALVKSSDETAKTTRTTLDEGVSTSSRTSALLAGATWIDVEVALPLRTPADEKLTLVAVVFAPDRFADDEALENGLVVYKELSTEGAFEFGRTLKPSDDTQAEELLCEALGGNRFRAPFPKGSKKGLLRLASRYTYLPELRVVELPSSAIRLDASLGAWFTGRLRLPGNLPSDIDPLALQPFSISINGFRMSADGERYGASTELASGLEFEFGGLHPGLTYFMRGKSAQFTAFKELQLTPQAGEHVARDYDLHVGALVSGRVLDESGAGVAKAKVDVRGKRQRGFAFDGPNSQNGVSDAEGRFALRAIEAGKNSITATLDGYVTATSEELVLADGQRLENVDLVLRRGKSLTGRVLWPDGKPAVGVEVEATEIAAKNDRRSRSNGVRRDAKTDDDGRFSLTGMTAESASVTASLELKQRDGEKLAGPWTAKSEDAALGVELVLTLLAPQEVRARVVDDLGVPITKFAIEQQAGGRGRGNRSQDKSFDSADGTASLMLAVGTHKLSAKADQHGESEPQDITVPGAVDLITFTLPRAAAITGLVLDPTGAPIAGASVDDEGEGNARWVQNGSEEANKSDAQGRFAMKCTTPGNVSLVATKTGFAPSLPQTVQVIAGQPIADIVLALRIGGRLEGEIYSASGAPDPGRQIMVGNFMSGGSVNETATSDVAGHFLVEHLAPGKHSVMAIPKMDALAGKEGAEVDETDLMSSMKMTTVEIVDQQTSHVVLGAPPQAPVHLSGRVTQAGKAYSDGVVMAIADGKTMLDSMKMGKLDGNGAYSLTLDAPGDYTIVVGQRMGDEHAAEVQETIPEVREYRVDIVVPLGGIRGRITSRDGKPLANVPISLEADGRRSILSMGMGRNIQTNESGRYEIKNVKPGTYTLRAGSSRRELFGNEKPAWGIGLRAGIVVEAERVLEDVDLRLDPPGTIEGTVRGTDGKPVLEAVVFVRDGEGRLLNPMSSCMTDGLGKFTFEGAPNGACTVSARSGNLSSRESGAVQVTDGHAATVDLRLESGTMLKVSVEDDAGKTVRASLRVLDENGRDFSNMMGGDMFEVMFSEGYSSTEVRIGPLPSGKYKVTATSSDGTSVTRPVTVNGQEERALRIKLKE